MLKVIPCYALCTVYRVYLAAVYALIIVMIINCIEVHEHDTSVSEHTHEIVSDYSTNASVHLIFGYKSLANRHSIYQ